MISLVVDGLPRLKELRLGHYDIDHDIRQNTGKVNYLAPLRKLEPGQSLGAAEVSGGNKGDIQQQPDKWRAGLHWVDFVKERE
jgi:hypothetical protein